MELSDSRLVFILDCRQTVFKVELAPESPEGLVKTQVAGLLLQGSDSVGLGWGSRCRISSQCSGDADLGIHLRTST